MLAWSGLASLATQFSQWSIKTANQFSMYVTDLLSFCKAKDEVEVWHGLQVAAVKIACGFDIGIVGSIHTQLRVQLVLKRVVMKLLHEIHRGEEPELHLVRLYGLEENLASKWGLLGMITMMKHRSKVKKGYKQNQVLKFILFIKCQGEWKGISKSGLSWKAVYLVEISTEVVPQAGNLRHSLTSDMARAGLEESE